ITVLSTDPNGWWTGKSAKGRKGIFPSNYVGPVSESPASPMPSPSNKHELLARVAYDFKGLTEGHLSFTKGSTVRVITKEGNGWWHGEDITTGEKGIFPSNYVQL